MSLCEHSYVCVYITRQQMYRIIYFFDAPVKPEESRERRFRGFTNINDISCMKNMNLLDEFASFFVFFLTNRCSRRNGGDFRQLMIRRRNRVVNRENKPFCMITAIKVWNVKENTEKLGMQKKEIRSKMRATCTRLVSASSTTASASVANVLYSWKL